MRAIAMGLALIAATSGGTACKGGPTCAELEARWAEPAPVPGVAPQSEFDARRDLLDELFDRGCRRYG
jgi:hypothetical protein